MDDDLPPGADGARFKALAQDLTRTEEEGQRIRQEIRRLVDELDRLSATRAEIEQRIRDLINGGDDEATGDSTLG